MPTSDNFDETLEFVAPVGGATTGTLIVFTAAQGTAVLPLTTATSGNTFVGKVTGRVKSVTKTTVAWITGEALLITTAGVAAAVTAGNFSNAIAATASAATATTGDVILRAPAQAN